MYVEKSFVDDLLNAVNIHMLANLAYRILPHLGLYVEISTNVSHMWMHVTFADSYLQASQQMPYFSTFKLRVLLNLM